MSGLRMTFDVSGIRIGDIVMKIVDIFHLNVSNWDKSSIQLIERFTWTTGGSAGLATTVVTINKSPTCKSCSNALLVHLRNYSTKYLKNISVLHFLRMKSSSGKQQLTRKFQSATFIQELEKPGQTLVSDNYQQLGGLERGRLWPRCHLLTLFSCARI